MEKLRDIKGLMEINEYSLYILIALVVIVLLVLFFIFTKFIFKKRKISKFKIAKEKLKNLDFLNSKLCSYDLSKYSIYVATKEDTEQLDKILEKYKYKKEIEEFSQNDLKRIKTFLSEHDV